MRFGVFLQPSYCDANLTRPSYPTSVYALGWAVTSAQSRALQLHVTAASSSPQGTDRCRQRR